MRTGIILTLALAANLTMSAEQPAAPGPLHAVPGDAQDLVLFLDTRPYLIRLHLQVNGRSFRSNWDESIAHLFRYLDVDGDGVLSKKEAALAPSKTQWVQLMTGTSLEPDSAPDFAELAGGAIAKNVSREHFSFYYRNSGAGALQIEWGWRPPSQDHLSDVLFGQLDKDKDGSLSRAELLAAQTALCVLDINGDDLIQAPELSSGGYYPSFNFRTTTEVQAAPANFPFAIVQPDTSAQTLASVLLNRYDRDKDGKLSRAEWQMEKAAFDRLDANHDGRLDAAELAGWRKSPPDLDMIVSLEQGARNDILILPEADGKPNRLIALLPPSRDGALRIPLAEKQLEVARGRGQPRLVRRY